MFRLFPLQVLILLSASAVAFADHGKGAVGGKTIGPRTLHEESFSLETGWRFQKSQEFSDLTLINGATGGHDMHSADWLAEFSLGVGYGVTNRLTLSLALPFEVLRGFRAGEFDGVNPATVEEATTVAGMGDATFLVKYSLLDDPVELAVLVGIKIPTGNTKQQNNANATLEPDHQPGSGSWDPLLGVAVARQFEVFTLGGSVLYRITSRGRHDFTPGQQVLVAVKAEVQVLGLGKFPRLYGSLELSEQFTAKDKDLSAKNHDTGGSIVGLGFGLRLRADEHMTISLTFTVPVYQGLYGEQHKERYEIQFGTAYDY
jgi:outer membrane putative beta-barrel porin/alpha-amylase